MEIMPWPKRICGEFAGHWRLVDTAMKYIRHAFSLFFVPVKGHIVLPPLRSVSTLKYSKPPMSLLSTEQIQHLVKNVELQIAKTSVSLAKIEELCDVSNREKNILALEERRSKLTMLQRNLSNELYIASTPAQDIIDLAKTCGVKLPAPKTPNVKAPRLPYHAFHSYDDIKILVGRSAADNDELSLNKEHRDDNYWWMHVADSPGSHVVVSCSASDIRQIYPETILDAAALTAKYSKCQSQKAEIHMTKCKHVRKPFGAKPGLVLLTGKVEKIRIDMKYQKSRLERLEASRSTTNNNT